MKWDRQKRLQAYLDGEFSIEEVIDHDQDGVIVAQRDPDALAASLKELLENPARRAELGRLGAQKIRQKFDVRVCETAFHQRVLELVKYRKLTP